MPESDDGYNVRFTDLIDEAKLGPIPDIQFNPPSTNTFCSEDFNSSSIEDEDIVLESNDSQEISTTPVPHNLAVSDTEPVKSVEKLSTGPVYEFPELDDILLRDTGSIDFGPMRSAVEKISGNVANASLNAERLDGSVESHKLSENFDEVKKSSITMLESLAASSLQLFPDGPDKDKRVQQNSRLDYVLQGFDHYFKEAPVLDPSIQTDIEVMRNEMFRALRMEMMSNKNSAIPLAQKLAPSTAGSVASSMVAGALSIAAGAVSKLFTKKSVSEWSDASFIGNVNGLLENVRQMKVKTDDSNYSGAVDFYEKNKKTIDQQMKDIPLLLQNSSNKGLTIRGETKDKCLEIQEKLEHIKKVMGEHIDMTINDVDKSNSQKNKEAKELMEKMKKMMDGITGPIQSIINAFKKILLVKPSKQSFGSNKAP